MSRRDKLYFELSVGGSQFALRYVGGGDGDVVCPPTCEYAVAWTEENDTKTHYFWFKLADVSYVLRAKYRALLGLDTTLSEITIRDVTFENVRNSFKRSRGIKIIGGNMAQDPFVYHKCITKQENSQNKRFDIQLKTIRSPNGFVNDSCSSYVLIDV